MNELISVRTNIFYEKEDKKFKRVQELVFIVDKPIYSRSNEGEIIRERGLDEFRLAVDEDSFEKLIEVLENLKDVEPDELI